MRSFPIDEDVVELVSQLAKPAPFEQLSFSDALRRILQASVNGSAPPRQAPDRPSELVKSAPVAGASARGRAPKADLRELVRMGLLSDGQELFLVDFRGQRHPRGRAKVEGSDLVYSDGKRYSMSGLASNLLKEQGYVADSVRGPDHWVTQDGLKIRQLWEGAVTGGSVH